MVAIKIIAGLLCIVLSADAAKLANAFVDAEKAAAAADAAAAAAEAASAAQQAANAAANAAASAAAKAAANAAFDAASAQKQFNQPANQCGAAPNTPNAGTNQAAVLDSNLSTAEQNYLAQQVQAVFSRTSDPSTRAAKIQSIVDSMKPSYNNNVIIQYQAVAYYNDFFINLFVSNTYVLIFGLAS